MGIARVDTVADYKMMSVMVFTIVMVLNTGGGDTSGQTIGLKHCCITQFRDEVGVKSHYTIISWYDTVGNVGNQNDHRLDWKWKGNRNIDRKLKFTGNSEFHYKVNHKHNYRN